LGGHELSTPSIVSLFNSNTYHVILQKSNIAFLKLLFDNNIFPAYFEDNDYCYRMRLAGLKRINSEFFNPEVFRNSQTIARDKSLNKNFDRNRERYKEKWGGYPLEETFTTPYNE
jgi:hypothetical protein